MDFSDETNPYDVLGIENGPETTAQDIAKAYKRMAILKHPDKNKNNPNAAAEFILVKKAYDVLCDEKARAAFDDLLRAKAVRAERVGIQSEKRRRMREELERRERTSAAERSEEEVARMQFKIELERLRRKAMEEEARARQRQAEAQEAMAAARFAQAAGPTEDVQEALQRTLKVKWDVQAGGDYTPQDLREAFCEFGEVEDVILKDSKKKRKGSALVVMSTLEAAQHAARSMCGRLSNPLLVVPFNKVDPVGASDHEALDDLPPAASGRAPADVFAMPAPARPVPAPSKPLFPSTSGKRLFPGADDRGASGGGGPPSSMPSFGSFPSAVGGSAFSDNEMAILKKLQNAGSRPPAQDPGFESKWR